MTLVRQGCPVSPLLFSLCLELFFLSIPSCNAIHGYIIQNIEVKILTYADDIPLSCTDKKSVFELAKKKNPIIFRGNRCSCQLEKVLRFLARAWATKPETCEGFRWQAAPCKYVGEPLYCYRDSRRYWEGVRDNSDKKAHCWGG